MAKTYAEKRFFEWHEDSLCVTLREQGGSYGGGSEVLVLESNQNHATANDAEVCPCLPAAMGNGGGYVPMIVEPIAFRDDITIKIDGGGVAFTLGARDFKGVQCVSYQKVTGCLSQGAHPGSYNGQDAYNDMLVIDDGNCNGICTGKCRNNVGGVSDIERKS